MLKHFINNNKGEIGINTLLVLILVVGIIVGGIFFWAIFPNHQEVTQGILKDEPNDYTLIFQDGRTVTLTINGNGPFPLGLTIGAEYKVVTQVLNGGNIYLVSIVKVHDP